MIQLIKFKYKKILTQKKVVKNSFYLYFALLTNQILSLLTVSYLSRMLGIANYGVLATSQVVVSYIQIFMDFGTFLYGSRKIAAMLAVGDSVERIIVAGFWSKAILLLFIFVFLLVFQLSPVLNLVPEPHLEQKLLIALGLCALASAFNPNWIYQGFEKINIITLLDVSNKLVTIIFVFWLVQKPSDVIFPIFISGFSSIILYGAATILIINKNKIKILSVRWQDVFVFLQKSSINLVFQLSTIPYTSAHLFILGTLASPSTVGAFAGAHRIYQYILTLFHPIIQSSYSRVSSLVSVDMQRAKSVVNFSLAILLVFSLTITIVLNIFLPSIINLLLGPQFYESVHILRTLSIAIPFVAASGSLAISWLMPLEKTNWLNVICMLASLIYFPVAISLCMFIGATGIAIAVVIIEAFVTISILTILYRNRLLPFLPK
ncbi:oligosaccharide flippase family protein [Chloroflexus sp.]|uniref:oligosaccharide flippase family protein n=1 Tax=Chloroflexus sp. TaxID=1904827 RepID=UPI003D134D6B